MEVIKKWIRNIRWLLNHPPIAIKGDDGSRVVKCDYCGEHDSAIIVMWQDGEVLYEICAKCRKKVYDSILG